MVAPDATAPPERAPDVDRRGAWMRVAFGIASVTGALVLAFVVTLPKLSLCTFQLAFGRPCPGCGMTRSIVNLARGDVVASLRFHPLGVVLLGSAVAAAIGAALGLVRGRDPVWDLMERRGPRIAAAFIVALFGLWIVRGFVFPEWSPDPIGGGLGWRILLPVPGPR